MAWQRRDPYVTDKVWFGNLFASKGVTMHACGTVRGVFYAAVSKSDPDKVFAWMATKEWRQTTHGRVFDFQDVTEFRGPEHDHAPASVLKALSPTDQIEALDWRDRCERNLAQKKAVKDIREGDSIMLDTLERFPDGDATYVFEVRFSDGAGPTVPHLYHNGTYCSVKDWRDRVVKIIRDGVTEIMTPHGESAAENYYVERVRKLRITHRQEVAEHYDLDPFYSPDWLARVEFREHGPWDGFKELEQEMMRATFV